MHLPHLTSRLYGTLLLLARSKLGILLAVLGDRIGWPEPHAAFVTPPPRFLPDAPPGIAVIPVGGTSCTVTHSKFKRGPNGNAPIARRTFGSSLVGDEMSRFGG